MDSHASNPPSAPLPPSYKPLEHESVAWQRWVDAGAFHADPQAVLRGEKQPYCVLIPPPNVTARLHLGHALNNTLQDILVRAHRMMGFETMWMPGTDHAGIATQAVVEKRLRNSGALTGPLRTSMKREEFVGKAQEFKDEYEAEITNQLKRMGCSCDFDRQRFTMDDQCAAAVREAFFRLFKDGLIYRGKRLVNWDCVLQTAVADDETYDEEVDGHFYYLRYPLVHAKPGEDAMPVTWDELARRGYPGANGQQSEEQAWITVATTRPETYLGDTAVAINPHDPRAKSLRGLSCELPLVGRVIPVIEDSYVVLPERYARDDEEKNDPKAKMATGFLKVTPAHDPNDYEIGKRHSLPIVNMLAPDGTVSDKHGWTDVGDAQMFVGRPREHARKMVVKEFDARGLLEGTKPHKHSLKHSDRSDSVVEPYLSDQWYVRVTDPRMAKAANEVLASASSGMGGSGAPPEQASLRFFPSRYTKTYEQWHENIRDWCISRQLWWGHRIPVWRCSSWGGSQTDVDQLRKGMEDWVNDGRASIQAGRLPMELATSTLLNPIDQWFVCVMRPDDAEIIGTLERLGFTQDPDVLDTWFSSALWPLSTMGWPDAAKFNSESNKGLLDAFNPTNSLCTAREIITLWVSRMVMFNRYFRRDEETERRRNEVNASGTPSLRNSVSSSLGPPPFHDVFIHCVIQDGQGQKMSKSLGNGVDPLDIIETHGADAMRFTLCHMATQTQDVRLPVDLICPHTGATFTPKMITAPGGYVVPAPIQTSPKDPSKKMVTVYGEVSGQAKPTPEMPLAKNTSAKFDFGRNFATKIWNASRLVFMSLGTPDLRAGDRALDPQSLSILDRWILSQLHSTLAKVNQHLTRYEFAEYAQALYDFVWRDFCDWYLEGIKPTIAKSPAQQAVLAAVLDAVLRMLHPVMPFVTETIWTHLMQAAGGGGASPLHGLTLGRHARQPGLLCMAPWPTTSDTLHDAAASTQLERIRELVAVIRDVRAKHQVKPSRKITLHGPGGGGVPLDNPEVAGLVSTFAGVDRIVLEAKPAEAPGSIAMMFDAREYRVSNQRDEAVAQGPGTAGDTKAAERARLEKLIADLTKSIGTLEGRLANPGYADRAPPAMVQQTRDQLAKAQADVAAAREGLSRL
ncbi:MAG TPA: valine--tRNA ligase [Phycisphaerales bacterium]|nr:valine--tRNA ligase [Phycisphaerales bacterium]